MKISRRLWVWLAVLGCVVVGASVYGYTASGGAYPGESARLVGEQTGLVPVLSPQHPLWRGLAWVLREMPVGTLARKLNLLSVCCGALALGLLYLLMHDLIYLLPLDVGELDRRTIAASHLAAVAAVLFLGFSPPFWYVSNRAHVASLDLLLLLATANLLSVYFVRGRFRMLVLAALLIGAGVVEFATMLTLLPLFGLVMFVAQWRNGHLRIGHFALLTLAMLAGLGVLFLAAWAFHGTMGYELRDYQSYWDIMWYALRDQYRLVVRGLPRTGWLLILFSSIAPWLVGLIVARRGFNDERDLGSAFLHVILTVLALSVLLNSKLSPWRMLGTYRLLVTPYLLMASLYGYLIAYWFLLPSRWRSEDETQRVSSNVIMGAFAVLPLMGVLLWMPIVNWKASDARPADTVDVLAGAIVESLDGCSWLVTAGAVDTHVQLAAYDRGIPLKIISTAPATSVYRQHVASLFDDPQLRSLISVGILPMLREWLTGHSDVASEVAIFGVPDLWFACGYVPVPSGMVYIGQSDDNDLGSLLPATVPGPYEPLWQLLEETQGMLESMPADVSRYSAAVIRRGGQLANNLGVLLEDAGRPDDAIAAYQWARRIDPENVSALLNLGAMAQRGEWEDTGGEVEKALAGLAEEVDHKFEIWSLAGAFGYVRIPRAYADLGWRWAQSGQASLAKARIEQALAMSGGDDAAIRHMLARIRLTEGDRQSSIQMLRELLDEQPDNVALRLRVAREEARLGDFERAEELVADAEAGGHAPLEDVAAARAFIALLRGDGEAVFDLLGGVARRHPDNAELWSLICEAALMTNNRVRLDDAMQRLEEAEGTRGLRYSLLRARLAVMERKFEDARGYFEAALVHRPSDVSLLESLLQLCILLNQETAAREYVRRLLEIDRKNPFALHILGSLHVADGRLEAAEASLRASLENRKNHVAMNDLAWVLMLRGAYAEAESWARKALAMQTERYSYHDTLGAILMKQERYAEAAEAFERALALSADIRVYVRMAQCQVALGDLERARALLEHLMPNIDVLDDDDRQIVSDLKSKVGD